MKTFVKLLAIFSILTLQQVKAQNEILQILDTAKDLTLQELNVLRPLFNEFQKQYDLITNALDRTGDRNVVSWQKEEISDSDIDNYVSIVESLVVKPDERSPESVDYDTQLPTMEELLGNIDLSATDITEEQRNELEDMQQILQESLDEVQTGMNELVKRALHIETEMLKLNKPKIVMYIYNALSLIFRYSAQLRRAAYCVYSHVPQLNESLENINAGVDCYRYTTKLVVRIQNEVVHTVTTLKKNVLDLASVYKKIAAKKTVFGKILTGLLNIFRILGDVRSSLAVANKALDNLENQLPGAAATSVQCATNFVETVPQITATAVNVTTCITYVETVTDEYEFLLPESERSLNVDDIDRD